MPKITARLLFSFAAIIAAGALIIGATFAFLSDTETSTGNTLEAGEIDLQIDNTSYYNGVFNEGTSWLQKDLESGDLFFNFTDLKPGDYGEDTISIHVGTNDSWVCADVTLTSDDDNEINEPEALDGDTTAATGEGELANRVNFIWWADDGDNVLEDDEDLLPGGPLGALGIGGSATIPLADSVNNIWGESALPGNTTRYIGKAWCFGELTIDEIGQDNIGATDPITNGPDTRGAGFTCDGSAENNITQTDSLTADISFSAIQSRYTPDFVCGETLPTPTPTISITPTPPVVSCTDNDIQYASTSSDNDQGLRKDSTPVLANRSIPGAAFGAPETSGADSDAGFPVGSFFSLGFPLGGNTASIAFGFAQPFYPNPTGPDLQIFEVTGGVYPDEKVKVEVSPDSITWTLAAASATRDEDIELPIPFAQYVRLTDVSDINLFSGTGDATPDGYDVDAIKTFCKVVAP